MTGAQLAPCRCRSTVPPTIKTRNMGKAKSYRYRCQACGAESPPTHYLDRLADVWNEAMRIKPAEGSVQVWPPIPGYYATRLVRGGPRVAVRIWFGPPLIEGEELDRSPRWCVEIDGNTDRWELDEEAGYRCRVPLEVERVWPFCAKEPIDEAEYRFLVADAAHAREWRPDDPKAEPRKAVDFNTLPMRF